ncbi:hypothetical protein LR48_Vigan04g014500 [Vigna angularis]|uniref:Uncharacterized protein n=1 Tax=Phaseolus angularis TaxID=3914 RepID=A0A0L9UBP5_PHAAN|nr:hypothetical protein LR48_Vigan04g014500 [Vigna angularis]
MVVVHIDSSFESSGGVGGSSARGDGDRGASPSSVSSSFLEETFRSSGREPGSPDVVGSRIINGIPIFLLKGGIRIDGSPFELDGDGTVVTEYNWAPYGTSLFASAYASRNILAWRVIRLHIVRDVEDFRLIWVWNERVYYGKRSSPDDFFYISHDCSCPLPIQLYGLQEGSQGQFVVGPGEGDTDCSSPPLVRWSSSTSRMPPVSVAEPQSAPLVEATGGPVPVGRAPVVEPIPSLGVVFVDPSSEAATASAAPLVRKRKDPMGEGHKDKEASSSRSASKKARKGKEKVSSPPLPGGIFSLAFNMSDQTKFHMSSSQRALIEPLSEVELTNAMLEMSTRATSLAWYLREFADRRGMDAVRAELLAEKKNYASLQSAMEELILTHDDYDKRIELLQADLKKAKKESADVSDRLAVARNDHERLLEECIQLKAKVSRQRSSENGFLRSNRALTDDLTKAREKISELEAGIVFEHEEGFNKALHQASVLTGVHEPFALGFDIKKDVFDGVLVDLNTMVDDEAPETEGPPRCRGLDDSGSSEITLCSPSGQVDSGSRGNSPFINLVFSDARTAVDLRKELSVHRPAKLTVVPGGTLRSSTWSFWMLGRQWFFGKNSPFIVWPSGSSERTLHSSSGQGDSGSRGNSPFINLVFSDARTAVVLRKELSIHRLAKVTVVTGGILRSSTWSFRMLGRQWFFGKNSPFIVWPR